MKMKRVIALLLCLALVLGAIVALAACGEKEEECTHSYSEIWSSDAQGHWYEATCDCDEAPIRKLNHVDNNNDGACDLCVYSDHTHTYAEGWTADCTNHWHEADCGHFVPGADKAEHFDENADGKCDDCAYVIEDIHEHYFDDAWSFDADNHWHAALCEHDIEVADVAAHEIDAAGYCTVCGNKVKEIDVTDIESVIAAAISRDYMVTDGNVVAKQLVYGYDKEKAVLVLENGGTNEVYYVLGNGQSYIFWKGFDVNGVYIGGDHQWYEQVSEDEVFGVQMQHGSYELEKIDGSAQFLSGYTYAPGGLLGKEAENTSTLANTIWGIYGIAAKGENVDNVEMGYDEETGIYSISYGYLQVNATKEGDTYNYQVYYYQVDVEFTVDENAVIDYATIDIDSYRNFEADKDLEYDPETNTFEMLPGANSSVYYYEVSQRSGERTFVSPYPRKSLVPTDFELSYVTGVDFDDDSGKQFITDEVALADTDNDGIVDLELLPGEYVRLHVVDIIPATALTSVMEAGDFNITYVNNDSGSDAILWQDKDFLRPDFSGYMDCITFRAEEIGDYTLTITYGDVTKVINVTVAEEVIEIPEDTDEMMYVEVTDTNNWEVDKYTFTAKEDGTYILTIPAGLGFMFEGDVEPTIDFYNPDHEDGGTVTLVLAADESVSFYVAAAEKGYYGIGIEKAHTCTDADKDHDCDNDECEAYLGSHSDSDLDHACDYGCQVAIGECDDKDKDHACDWGCDKTFGTCADTDLDHDCDYGCDKTFGDHADGDDNNHICDYGCGKIADDGCYDEVVDGKCDECGVDIDHECADSDLDHACDICSKNMGTCADTDFDHACDYGCDKVYGDHVDSGKDHVCDWGCQVAIGDHTDGDLDHVCDYGCQEAIGNHADGDDSDHLCDYGCGDVADEGCYDNDDDGVCDECGTVLAPAVLVEGENIINVTAGDIANNAIAYNVTVTETATYEVTSESLFVNICRADDTLISRNMATLEPGDYIFYVVVANLAEPGEYSLTLTISAPESNNGGTENDPTVLDSLNCQVNAHIGAGNDDLYYYAYAAPLSGTLTITYSNSNSWIRVTDKTDGQNSGSTRETATYTFEIIKGHEYLIALGVWVAETEPHVVTLSFVESAVQPEDPIEPPACVHVDADDDLKCDECDEAYHDGIDKPGVTYTVGNVGTFTIHDDGTATFIYNNPRTGRPEVKAYTYEPDGNGIKLVTLNGNPISSMMAVYFGVIECDADGKPIKFTFENVNYNLTEATDNP